MLTQSNDIAIPQKTHTPVKWFGVSAFTEPAFVFSLKLALFYPILAVFLVWLFTGQDASPGGMLVFPEMDLSARLFTLLGLLVMTGSFIKFIRSDGWHFWLWLVLFVAGVGVGAVAGAFAAEFAYDYSKSQRKLARFWCFYLLLLLCCNGLLFAYLSKELLDSKNALIWALFYSILPLLNAPLDWVSTAITRSLLYAIVDELHSGYKAFLWALIDILIALALLVLITLLLAGSIAIFNAIAINNGGAAILDLAQIFANLQRDPWASDNWWIYCMLLSTLLPTFIHLIIASFSLILWVPQHWLKWISKGWQPEQHKHDSFKFIAAWLYFSVLSPVALFAPIALLYGTIWLLLLPGSGEQLGNWLLSSAHALAAAIDPSL